MLGGAFGDLLAGPAAVGQLDLLRPVALDLALDPQEHLGPHGLRTGVPTPQPAGDGGEQEQGQRRDDQDGGEIEQILRPEGPEKKIELAPGQVDQERLPAFTPVDPRQSVIKAERGEYHDHPPAREETVYLAGVDLLAFGVQRFLGGIGLGQRDDAHGKGAFGGLRLRGGTAPARGAHRLLLGIEERGNFFWLLV